jgi:hypothetical protein
MRKRIINRDAEEAFGEDCLDLERLARVEVTSEDAAHPIEAALMPGGQGWRAAQPGEQVVRLLFDEPTRLGRIRLVFNEDERGRTQEFVLRWSADGRSYREIVRQQYTFSPPSTSREVEDYRVDLEDVAALELKIVPDMGGSGAPASLTRLCLA